MGASKKSKRVPALGEWNWATIATVLGAITGLATLVFSVWTVPTKESKPDVDQRVIALPADAVQALFSRNNELYDLLKQYGISKPLLGTGGLMAELDELFSPDSLKRNGNLVSSADFLTLTNTTMDVLMNLKLDGSAGLSVADRLGPGETVFVCIAISKQLAAPTSRRYDRLNFERPGRPGQVIQVRLPTTRMRFPGVPGATVGYPPDQRVN